MTMIAVVGWTLHNDVGCNGYHVGDTSVLTGGAFTRQASWTVLAVDGLGGPTLIAITPGVYTVAPDAEQNAGSGFKFTVATFDFSAVQSKLRTAADVDAALAAYNVMSGQVVALLSALVPPQRQADLDRRIAETLADRAVLVAALPWLAAAVDPADLVILRDKNTLQPYLAPLAASVPAPTIYGGGGVIGAGVWPSLRASNFIQPVAGCGPKAEIPNFGANIMALFPFYLPRAFKWQAGNSGFAVPVKTASVGLTRICAVLYKAVSKANPYPGAIVDWATDLPANADWNTGVGHAAGDIALDPGLYWVGLISEGGDETYWGYPEDSCWAIGGASGAGVGTGDFYNGFSIAETFHSNPATQPTSPFTGAQPLKKLGGFPDIRVRIVEL